MIQMGFSLSRMKQIDIFSLNITESSEKEISCFHTGEKEDKCCWPECYGELQNLKVAPEGHL